VNLVAAVLAVPLLVGGIVPAAPPADGSPTIELTTRNWGRTVSLTDPNDPAYAHPFVRSSLTTVEAVIHFGVAKPQGFTAALVDAGAYEGRQPDPCSSAAAPAEVSCVFNIAATPGVNALTLTLTLPGSSIPVIQKGWITGGALSWSGGLEAIDAAGIWQRVPDGGELRLPARQFTSVRYVVRNVGGVPFTVHGACGDGGGTVEPGSSIACPIAGPRPVASLAASYDHAIELEDPLASIGQAEFGGTIVSTPASFQLSSSRVVVGQQVSLATRGITDRDLGLLNIRVGSRPLRLDPESTAQRIRFAIPFAAAGETHLDVLQSGVTIARIPLTITATREAAPPAPFPVALVVLLAVGGALLALLLWRGVSVAVAGARRRRRAATAG
jgi:hypothetical protein